MIIIIVKLITKQRKEENGESVRQKFLGNEKELFDYYFNRGYKGLSKDAAEADMKHDLDINRIGRDRAKNYNYASPQEACADFREYNKSFPQKYW